MKNINNFISEKLVINKDLKMSSTGKDYWSFKDMDKSEMLDLVKKALRKSNIKPKDIQDELSGYEDIEDLEDAHSNNELDNYSTFENEMYNLLETNSKYNGINDNIMDSIWTHAYDIMDEIINKDA